MHITDLKIEVLRLIIAETIKGDIKWELGLKELSFYGQRGNRELRLGWFISRHLLSLRLKCDKGTYSIIGFEDSVKECLKILKRTVQDYSKPSSFGREELIKNVQRKSNSRTKKGEKESQNSVLQEFLSVLTH